MKHYGWKRDLPDQRDYHLALAVPPASLPPQFTLPNLPDVFDQGELGSCTANAIANAYLYDLIKQQGATFIPSRLFIYYNERVLENSIGFDSGASIRDSVKAIASKGVCPESFWPYDIPKFTILPTPSCFLIGNGHRAIRYSRLIQSLNQLKASLVSGYPFVFGFSVYESFESEATAHTGVVTPPQLSEALMGAHAGLAIGYNDAAQRFFVMNSWGKEWGQGGFFTMPYSYITDPNLAADFWVVQLVR